MFAICLFLSAASHAQTGIIYTIAGNGTAGFSGDGGPATAALLNEPTDVRKDAAGNIYIADNSNHRIRKINPAGIISTIAGTGVPGFSGDGGPAVAAQLNNPDAVDIDAAGNIYIADMNNNRIRKITAGGIISTIAGTGAAGFSGDGGAAVSAQINKPSGVAVDLAGNIYISDRGNDRVRKVTPGGIISTYAGGGAAGYTVDGVPATSISLCTQNYVSVDNAGTVYITNTGCWHFLKVSTAGLIYNVAGDASPAFTGDCGPATVADIAGPQGISPDNLGNLYLAPRGNRRIRRVNSLNYIKTVAGTGGTGYTGDGGPALNATVSADLAGVFADASGNIYFADMSNHAIRTFTTTVYTDSAVICVGSTVTLSSSTSSGTWISGNTTVATVTGTSTTGVVTGVSGGTAIITFSNIACPDLFKIRVDSLPPIAAQSVCTGSTATFTTSYTGGSWSSSNTAVGTIVPGTGVATGITSGTAIITFTSPVGCYTTTTLNVVNTPSAISGLNSVCAGATIPLSNTVSGGTWSSGSPGVATVTPGTGIVTGVSGGSAIISYTIGSLCRVVSNITVNPLPVAGTITGPASVCQSAAITLSNVVAGGTWSSGATGIATIDAAGTVYGISGGAVTISYTVSNTCDTVTTTKAITVNSSDTSYFNTDTIVCAATAPLTLSGPAGYTSYLWSTGSTATSINVIASGVYIHHARQGCDTRIDTFHVTFNPMPVVSLGNDTSFCSGDTLILSSPQPGGSVYVWSTGSSTATISVATSGTYSLTVTDSLGCSTTDTIQVIIFPRPVVNLGPDTTVCDGGPVVLQSSVLYPPAVTYVWSTGATTPSLSVTATNIYWLEVSLGSCISNKDSISVTVLYDTFHLYTPDTAICRGASVQVRAAGHPAITYLWLPTAGLPLFTVVTPVITPDTSATYIVTASFPGCPDIIDSLHIDVQPNPVLYLGPQTRFVCRNDTLHLHASVSPAWYSHYIYHWSPTIYVDDSDMADVAYTPDDTVWMVATVSTPAGCSVTDSILINVYPDNFAGLDTNISLCPHDSAQLFLVSADSFTTYNWLPPLYISDPHSATPKLYPITSQDYIGVATSTYGCLDTVHANVVVAPAGVIFAGDDVTVYPGETYQINPQSNCTWFTWSPMLGLSNPYISDPVVTPQASTTYYVRGVTEWGCPAMDSISIKLSEESFIDVPNAFAPGGDANKLFKVIKRGIVTLRYMRIYNRWGNVVFETTNIDEGWDGTWNGKPQPFGVYVYSIEGVTSTGKVKRRQGNVTLVR